MKSHNIGCSDTDVGIRKRVMGTWCLYVWEHLNVCVGGENYFCLKLGVQTLDSIIERENNSPSCVLPDSKVIL